MKEALEKYLKAQTEKLGKATEAAALFVEELDNGSMMIHCPGPTSERVFRELCLDIIQKIYKEKIAGKSSSAKTLSVPTRFLQTDGKVNFKIEKPHLAIYAEHIRQCEILDTRTAIGNMVDCGFKPQIFHLDTREGQEHLKKTRELTHALKGVFGIEDKTDVHLDTLLDRAEKQGIDIWDGHSTPPVVKTKKSSTRHPVTPTSSPSSAFSSVSAPETRSSATELYNAVAAAALFQYSQYQEVDEDEALQRAIEMSLSKK